MNQFWLRAYLASWLLLLLPACHLTQRLTRNRYYHQITAQTIVNAELIDGTEIDSGRYVLFAYEYFSDRRCCSDNWQVRKLFVKAKSLENLSLGQALPIPAAGVTVSGYTQSTWYFGRDEHIAGTITRVMSTPAGHRLRLDLHSTDKKSNEHILLAKTLFFRNESDYFERHRIDHKGKYEDLRLALKEPAKVKTLDLTTHAIQYRKRNGRDSGPDTLYRRLGELYNLEELNLYLSDMKAVPASIIRLKRLKKLNLGYNHLTVFPAELLALDSLQELNLEWNQLDSIPVSIAQLKSLRVLNLDDNRLQHYPMAINGMVGLRELSLSNANLRVIPLQIQQLVSLEVLNLDGFWNSPRKNQLIDISALGSLARIRSLSIKENGTIQTLPESFYQLKNLEYLNLQMNPIDSAQVDTRRLPKLKKLEL